MLLNHFIFTFHLAVMTMMRLISEEEAKFQTLLIHFRRFLPLSIAKVVHSILIEND